jgi:hypothetical protein
MAQLTPRGISGWDPNKFRPRCAPRAPLLTIRFPLRRAIFRPDDDDALAKCASSTKYGPS